MLIFYIICACSSDPILGKDTSAGSDEIVVDDPEIQDPNDSGDTDSAASDTSEPNDPESIDAVPVVSVAEQYSVLLESSIVYAQAQTHESFGGASVGTIPLKLDAFVPDNDEMCWIII